MKKIILSVIICAAFVALMPSCNVTRVITNESKSIQRGDTAIVIQTKTIESYDAKSNGLVR